MRRVKPVCTRNEAREYFSSKGLTYNDIYEGDILILTMMVQTELKRSNKNLETSTGNMSLSSKIDIKKSTNGHILSCFMYMNSHYFTRREAITFNADGFIGFAGWADIGNTNPLLRAFLKWCDYLAEQKEVQNEQIHSADVVEVVRCKDCKFSQENDGKLMHGARYCENEEILGYGNYMSVWDSNYCSHGARMDGGTDVN